MMIPVMTMHENNVRIKIATSPEDLQDIQQREGTKTTTATIDMQNIVPESSRIVSSLLQFRAGRVKQMTGVLGSKIIALYASEDEAARCKLTLEITVIIDKISDLVAKNIDDVTRLENTAMRQTVINAIQQAETDSTGNRDDLRYFV